MKKIDIVFIKEYSVEQNEDEKGAFFMIGQYKARVLPHINAKHLTPNDVLTFFIQQTDAVATGIIANYLYNLIKEGKAKNVKIGDNLPTDIKNEIEKNLEDAKHQ